MGSPDKNIKEQLTTVRNIHSLLKDNFTFVQISGLLGLCWKSSTNDFSPIARSASGKYNLNQESMLSAVQRRSSSAVGANKVHVNVLSL